MRFIPSCRAPAGISAAIAADRKRMTRSLGRSLNASSCRQTCRVIGTRKWILLNELLKIHSNDIHEIRLVYCRDGIQLDSCIQGLSGSPEVFISRSLISQNLSRNNERRNKGCVHHKRSSDKMPSACDAARTSKLVLARQSLQA